MSRSAISVLGVAVVAVVARRARPLVRAQAWPSVARDPSTRDLAAGEALPRRSRARTTPLHAPWARARPGCDALSPVPTRRRPYRERVTHVRAPQARPSRPPRQTQASPATRSADRGLWCVPIRTARLNATAKAGLPQRHTGAAPSPARA